MLPIIIRTLVCAAAVVAIWYFAQGPQRQSRAENQGRVRNNGNSERFNPYRMDSCAICIDNFSVEDTLTLLKCNHAFHTKCIKPILTSLNNAKKCPICRDPITTFKDCKLHQM